MDYLNRDSFYTGVSEGVIGYDRILQMLTVQNDVLMVEEKGVHSVEKFIVARRLMYWQVYLHKTVLSSEILLINILRRAKEIAKASDTLFATPALNFFLYNSLIASDFKKDGQLLDMYCQLDDNDIITSIKIWQSHKDAILSNLCKMLINRNLYKVILSSKSLENEYKDKLIQYKKNNGSDDFIDYYVSTGIASNNTYNINDERIQIAMKNGTVLDISAIDNPVVNQALAKPVNKNYLCFTQSFT
jgi:HD superfamily phosphohydrolase